MTIICLVTNDLAQDQRMDRICSSLVAAGHEVTLVGRLLPTSKELPDRVYRQHRIRCRYHKGKLFYAEYNYLLVRELRSWHYDAICAVDLDTLLAGVWLTSAEHHKLVFDAHEWFSETPEVVNRTVIRGFWRGMAKALVPKTDARYTVAPMLAGKLAEEYGAPFGTVRNLPLRRLPSTNLAPAAAPPSLPKSAISPVPSTPASPPTPPTSATSPVPAASASPPTPPTSATPPTLPTSATPASPPTHYPLPTTNYPLIYQGMLNPGRGLVTALAALADLPDCQLWLIGDGPEMEHLRQCARDFGVEDRVWFAGFRPPAELPALTAQAWLGLNLLDAVSPSYYYSLANKAFDYIQAGLPSVQMAFPEYCSIQDTYGCYALLESLEPSELVAIVERLIAHPTAYQQLVAASERAAAELVWENEIPRLLEIWEAL